MRSQLSRERGGLKGQVDAAAGSIRVYDADGYGTGAVSLVFQSQLSPGIVLSRAQVCELVSLLRLPPARPPRPSRHAARVAVATAVKRVIEE